MDPLPFRPPRGLLLPLLTGLFSFMLLLSIYYLPAAENVVSYFGFRHGSKWDLAHGSVSSPASSSSTPTYNANDSAVWAAHLEEVSASAKAAHHRPHATGTGTGTGVANGKGKVSVSSTGVANGCHVIEGGASDILVVMRTRAVEIEAKLPTQLSTVLSCVPNYIVISELDQDFHGQYVHDALWHVDQRYKDSEPEFEYQRTLRSYRDSGMDMELLRTTDSEQQRLGETLQKWMDVPALHLAYTLWRNVSWYVFVDGDAYLSLTNLLEVVRRMDAEKPVYTGFKAGSGKNVFAQGGSGYLISRTAAEMFDKKYEEGGKGRWEKGMVKATSGDAMLGTALKESGVMFGTWPQGSVFQNNSIEMFSGWEEMWCLPAVSWHYSGSAEIQRIWEWERHLLETREDTVIRYRDVFEGLVEPKIRKGHVDGWDNFAAWKVLLPLRANSTDEEIRLWEGLEELEVDPTTRWDACEKACQLDRGCLSWQYGPGKCSLGSSVIIGRKIEGEVKFHGLAISGWNMKRIKRWKERIGPCT